MQYQGSIGYAGSVITFDTPQSIGITMPDNTYPEGTLTFDNISDGNAYWKNNSSSYARSINLYLCDSAGNNRVFLFTEEESSVERLLKLAFPSCRGVNRYFSKSKIAESDATFVP